MNKNNQVTKHNKYLLGFLDTGAIGIFVQQTALDNIQHQIKPTNMSKDRYTQSCIIEIALFDIKLSDFYNSPTVAIQACVEEEAVVSTT
jgi:hypothetical protein